ncbi:MAG TPA: oligosaccharide flippase family protein, partial [Gemmatimonadaceae bacterium]
GWALSIAIAWPLGGFFREPLLPPVVTTMSAVLLFTGLGIVPKAVMQRQLQYRSSAMMEAARSIVQTVFVLGGALLGLGYWALALGAVAASFTATVAALTLSRVAFARPSLARLRRPLHYARNLFVGGLAWQAYSMSDFVVIGRIRGSAALGLYTLAWNVASVPGEKLTNLLSVASSSFFASLRGNDVAMRRYYLVLTEGIALLTFPVLAGICAVAADAVVVLWGEEWRASILPLRLLAIHAMLNSIATPLPQILNATGQVVATRRNALFALAILLPAFYVAARMVGITAVAACWLLLYPIVKAKPFLLVKSTLGLSLSDYLQALRPAVLISTAMLVILATVRIGVTSTFDPKLRLACEVAAGGGSVCIMLRLTYWKRLTNGWRFVRSRRETLSAQET